MFAPSQFRIVTPIVFALAAMGGDQHSVAEDLVVENATAYWKDQVRLASDRPGVLRSVPYRLGAKVKANSLVAKLDDRVAAAAMAKALKKSENTVDRRFAEKSRDVAEIELEKNRQANADFEGIVPEIQIEKLALEAERAKLQVEQAEFQTQLDTLEYEEAKTVFEQHRIETPIAGTVVKVEKFPGEAVGQGDVILHVVNTDVMRIEGLIPFAETARVRPGQPVEFTVPALPDTVFTGKVVFVDLFAEPLEPFVKVIAEIDNEGGRLREQLEGTLVIDLDGMVEGDDENETDTPAEDDSAETESE